MDGEPVYPLFLQFILCSIDTKTLTYLTSFTRCRYFLPNWKRWFTLIAPASHSAAKNCSSVHWMSQPSGANKTTSWRRNRKKFFWQFPYIMTFSPVQSLWDFLELSFIVSFKCQGLTTQLITQYQWFLKHSNLKFETTSNSFAFKFSALYQHFVQFYGLYHFQKWWRSIWGKHRLQRSDVHLAVKHLPN